MLLLALLSSFALLTSSSDVFRPKVLVYSIQSGFSHVNFMGRVADTLAEGGMDVTLLLNELRTEIGSGTTKARVFPIERSQEAVDYITDPSNDESKSIYDGSSHDLRSMLNFAPLFNKIFYLSCKNLLSKPEILEQLRAEKYDVMLAETFDYCGFGLAKILGIKSTVAVFSSSLNDYTAWITGTPSPWSVVQSAYSGVVDRSLSSRLWNLLCVAADFRVNHLFVSSANQAFEERFGEGFPSIQELISNSSLIVTAGDPLLDLARPTQRKIIDIGAIGIREAKPLEKEYDDLLNLRPRTIVFSLGLVAQTSDMPIAFKRGLIEAFKRFPYVTFLWKYEKPEEANSFLQGVDNVILRKWIPQNDLIGDPRVVALITHGGKTSLNEVGAKGLPTVFIPIYGDQPRNAAIAVKLGFGVFLNKQNLDQPDVIESAISAVLNDKKYSESAKLVAEMMRSRPFSAKELLVKHVKFAAQFGNVKSLDQEGFDYPLYIYWNVDVLMILMLIVLTPIFVVYLCISRYLCSKSNAKKMEYVLLVVHGCFGIIGLPANSLLIFAIIYARDQGLQSYSVILFNIAITDVIAIITDMLTMTRIVANAPWVIFIYQGGCRTIDQHLCFWSHDVMVHLFFHSILLIAVSFWFRSAVLSGSVPSAIRLQTALLLALLPTLVLIRTFEFGLTLSGKEPALQFLKGVHPEINISEITYGIINTFNPGGMATTLWVCIHPFIAYSAIFYNRRQVKRKLNELSLSMSAKTRKMHESLILALTYHSILPSTLCVAVTFFLLQQFNVARNPLLESTVFMSTTIPSVFNPLLTIYFVGPYRRLFMRLFCCKTRKGQRQATNSITAVAAK